MGKNRNRLYYAVYTDSGFGVFTSKEEYNECMFYIIEPCYGQLFNNLECAFSYAITGYNAFQSVYNLPYGFVGILDLLTVNHYYNIEDIIECNSLTS